MNTFDPTLHPRARSGQFAAKQGQTPAPLAADDAHAAAILRDQEALVRTAVSETLHDIIEDEEFEARYLESIEMQEADMAAGLIEEPDFDSGVRDWESLGTPF